MAAEKPLASMTASQKKAAITAVSKATGNTSYLSSPSWNAKPTAPATGKSGWGQPTGKSGWGATPTAPSSNVTSTNPLSYNQNDKYYQTSISSQNTGFSFQGGSGNNLPAKFSPAPATISSSPTNPMAPTSPAAPALPQQAPTRARETASPTPAFTAQPEQPESVGTLPGFKETRLNEVGQKFFQDVGAHSNYIKDQIAQFEERTGKEVAVNSRAFQAQLKSVMGDQKQWPSIFKRFAHEPGFLTTISPEQSSKERIDTTISRTMVPASLSPEEQISQILNDAGSDTLHSQLEQLMALPPESSGETLIRNMLMLTLGAIEQDDINELLDSQEKRVKDSYYQGLAMIDAGTDEIDKAIDGLLEAPETSTGLLAKIYAEGKEETLSEIAAQKAYATQRQNIIMSDMRQKRADLVGYTKAKLYSMGAEDSSAGVALLGKIVSEADMQITLAELDFNEGIRQLDSAGRTAIRDFTYQVADLVIKQDEKEVNLEANYQDSLLKIEENRFTTEREKRKQTLQAYADYTKNIFDYREKSKAEQRQALNDYYTRLSQARDDAYKMSGLTGTIFFADEEGKLVDTQIPTFQSKVYGDERAQNLLNMELSVNQDRRSAAQLLLNTYGSAAAGAVEQMLGLPTGALSGFQTQDELNRAFNMITEGNEMYKWQVQNALDTENGKLLDTYYAQGGGIKSGGIGVSPFSLPDVRQSIIDMGNVTQGFKAGGTGGTDMNGGHGGIDYVSKDGYSRAVRGGTVLSITPWDGNSAWGNQVRIIDDTGVVWQYSHLGDRDTQNDFPFTVQVGQRVDAGEVLGREGNTGRVISKYTGKGAGRHTDLRIVGQLPANATLSDKEQDKVIGYTSNWLKDYAPEVVQKAAPSMFDGEAYTLQDLIDVYVKSFKEYPSSNDQKLLEQYGYEGLKMIESREKETKTGSLTL